MEPIPSIAITGSTGFLGHYVLADLLRAGHSCHLLLRNPEQRSDEIDALLRPLGVDAPAARRDGRLTCSEGDVGQRIPTVAHLAIESVIHAAACTDLGEDRSGETRRINVGGTSQLLDWAQRQGVRRIIHVSTAFVAGAGTGVLPERLSIRPDSFRNAYEESKWLAEQEVAQWARSADRVVTIVRPSIIVGDELTGRATSECGLYLFISAVGAMVERASRARSPIRLRIPCAPGSSWNLVPVDYVARVIAAIHDDFSRQGGVYNAVHPSPAPAHVIKSALEEALGAGDIVVADDRDQARSALESAFDRLTAAVRPYLASTLSFDSARTRTLEQSKGFSTPPMDASYLLRLIRAASRPSPSRPAGIGRPSHGHAGSFERSTMIAGDARHYFETFLPDRLPHSSIGVIPALTCTVRFALIGTPDEEWILRLSQGRLVCAPPGVHAESSEFGYRMDRQTFRAAVRGDLDGPAAFMNGRVEITGDVERALKFAVLMQAFNRESPFDILEQRSCTA